MTCGFHLKVITPLPSWFFFHPQVVASEAARWTWMRRMGYRLSAKWMKIHGFSLKCMEFWRNLEMNPMRWWLILTWEDMGGFHRSPPHLRCTSFHRVDGQLCHALIGISRQHGVRRVDNCWRRSRGSSAISCAWNFTSDNRNTTAYHFFQKVVNLPKASCEIFSAHDTRRLWGRISACRRWSSSVGISCPDEAGSCTIRKGAASGTPQGCQAYVTGCWAHRMVLMLKIFNWHNSTRQQILTFPVL